jgi:type VI secretion system secreted protein Hcp
VGIGSGGGTGTVNLTSFSIEKYTDASSAELFQHMCAGEHFPVGKLTLYKSGGAAGALPYLTYDFEEMYVDDLQWGGGGDIPHESVSFSFGKIIITYTEQSAAGTAQGDHVGSWDVRTVSP